MSFRSSLIGSVFPGIGAGRPAAAKPKPASEDEDMSEAEKKRRARNKAAGRAEDDDDEEDDAAAAAQSPDDDEEEDDEDDEDDDEKKRDEEDDEDEEEMSKNAKDKKVRGARQRERARCAAIFAHPAAKGRMAAAAQIAFGTNTPRHQAGRLLATMPLETPPSRRDLAARMEGYEHRSVTPGGEVPRGQAKAIAEAEAVYRRLAVSPNSDRKA